ncbi:hypothetical protein L195_g062924, partial [Trifolium pratense]
GGSSDDRAVNDDAEAADEEMAVRSRWKRKRMRSQFGEGWQATDLFRKEATPVATLYLFRRNFTSLF